MVRLNKSKSWVWSSIIFIGIHMAIFFGLPNDGDMTVPHSSYSSHIFWPWHPWHPWHIWGWVTAMAVVRSVMVQSVCIQGWHCRSTMMALWLYMIFDPSRPGKDSCCKNVVKIADNSPVNFHVALEWILMFSASGIRRFSLQMAFDELLGSRCVTGWLNWWWD